MAKYKPTGTEWVVFGIGSMLLIGGLLSPDEPNPETGPEGEPVPTETTTVAAECTAVITPESPTLGEAVRTCFPGVEVARVETALADVIATNDLSDEELRTMQLGDAYRAELAP